MGIVVLLGGCCGMVLLVAALSIGGYFLWKSQNAKKNARGFDVQPPTKNPPQ